MKFAPVVESILWDCFPDHCALVGPSRVTDIVEGGVTAHQPGHGQRLDLKEPLEFLAAAAGLAAACIEIVKAMLGRGEKPEPGKIEIKITSGDPQASRMSSDQRRAVYVRVIEYHESEAKE